MTTAIFRGGGICEIPSEKLRSPVEDVLFPNGFRVLFAGKHNVNSVFVKNEH